MTKVLFALIFLVCTNLTTKASDLTPAEARALKPEAMRLWEKRADPEALAEALSKFELMHVADPSDPETLLYLSRGHYLMGEFHVGSKDHKMRIFEKGKHYGEKGMATNAEYKKKADQDKEKAIATLTEKEAPLAYWTAANLGKWSKLNGVMASLKYKDEILGLISRVEKLQPDYFYGAVPRFWGGFYAVAPGIAGGDMKKAKKKFEQAIAMAPEFLGNRVLYAELYWVEKGNKKEFSKELEAVLAAPLGPQEIAPENTLEKQKAQELLNQKKKLF